jgi:hypothetical protein
MLCPAAAGGSETANGDKTINRADISLTPGIFFQIRAFRQSARAGAREGGSGPISGKAAELGLNGGFISIKLTIRVKEAESLPLSYAHIRTDAPAGARQSRHPEPNRNGGWKNTTAELRTC